MCHSWVPEAWVNGCLSVTLTAPCQQDDTFREQLMEVLSLKKTWGQADANMRDGVGVIVAFIAAAALAEVPSLYLTCTPMCPPPTPVNPLGGASR